MQILSIPGLPQSRKTDYAQLDSGVSTDSHTSRGVGSAPHFGYHDSACFVSCGLHGVTSQLARDEPVETRFVVLQRGVYE